MPEKERRARLAERVTPDVTYTDPNVSLEGVKAFSDFVTQFQNDVPGGHFVITGAYAHHRRTLAHWKMLGPDSSVMLIGVSVADVSEDGKFTAITGFFGGPDAQASTA